MAEAKIQKLKTKRTTLIAQQKRIEEFVTSKLSSASISEVQIRLKALDKYYEDFESVQAAIEDHVPEEVDTNIRAQYEESYFSLQPALMVALDSHNHVDAEDSLNQTFGSTSLKLPKIVLPNFAGDYTQWLSYYETFQSLVHKNALLDNYTRFHYFRSSLKEGTLRRIESIEVTPENYSVALKLLVDRYQKKTKIVREHIRHLLNLPSIASKSTVNALRDLIDSVNIHLRALKSLGRPVAQWDDLIVELILTKLDSSTLEKWNDEANIGRVSTLDELLKFLDKRCNHLEERASTRQLAANSAQSSQKQHFSKPTRASLTATNNQKMQRFCTYCITPNHVIYRCHAFINLTPKQRFDATQERNLCHKCLKCGHTQTACHLNTVTYGTSCAPYLATRCLTKLAEDSATQYPAAATAILKETYVDDIMTGAYTLEAASQLLADIQNMLSSARFELRNYFT